MVDILAGLLPTSPSNVIISISLPLDRYEHSYLPLLLYNLYLSFHLSQLYFLSKCPSSHLSLNKSEIELIILPNYNHEFLQPTP